MKKVEKIIVNKDKKDFIKLFSGEDGKPLERSKECPEWQDHKLYPVRDLCVQCGKELSAILELEKWTIPVCTEPSCPNFGLLQIGVKKMYEFIDKEKKMNEEKMVEILEGLDIEEDKIAQIVNQFAEQLEQKKSDGIIADDFLDGQIERETDSLKKASLIAKRISKNME